MSIVNNLLKTHKLSINQRRNAKVAYCCWGSQKILLAQSRDTGYQICNKKVIPIFYSTAHRKPNFSFQAPVS